MNYIYASLLLHSAGKQVTEDNVKTVVESTGEKSDVAKVKALVAALKDVNIEDAIKKAAIAPVAAAPEAKAEVKEEKKAEEEKKTDEEAAAGLGALFG